ncbi:hypothetical protein DS909_18460 [Phaeobacter gallaeciensis]|uniref:Lipoprotein n=2 Tax=Roseobacteraceae TaxID=2854170 RepID=A0A366WQF6_9RHOB|nr:MULTISPECIES: hypothetical protein [Roseobacteraceae]MBT3143047.1 hypothetical protein [Falsiruegeria litorea]MBT8166849.1 hypothetical protein [Falsiruegeria litorea]RBW51573.1 hypothetical protein DS909_18460 [Phaeobacter gallaeciensis]
MKRLAPISLCALAACGPPPVDVTRFAPDYLGVETALLEGDLVQFDVQMAGARDGTDLDAYAECAAAQYALIRGYGFARHLRTNVNENDGVWAADAIYTISPSLPRGLQTIDAEVVVANCAENGIPTV